ncbi:MAG TPA: Uma2 family endonuclease [Vicinamibacterales bacterium]
MTNEHQPAHPPIRTVDYLSTAETTRPRELVYGMVREPPAPFFSHQQLVLVVARLLQDHVDAHGLGRVAIAPLDVILDAEAALIVQPDVMFVSTERLSLIRDQIWGAPDLVVEVLSAGNEAYDRGQKLGWYRQYGVRECWLVDLRTQAVAIVDFTRNLPETRVAKGLDAIRSSVLPGLTATGFSVFTP